MWKTFETRKAAHDLLNDRTSAIAAGTYQRVTPTGMADVLKTWQETLEAGLLLGSLKRSTYRSYVSLVARHQPAFGRCRTDELTPAVTNEWRSESRRTR